jgi:two-component system, chemotaxis family, sensor kinase Cph1
VSWAGDPHKPVEIQTLDTGTRLLPRTSFALWKEEVRGRSAAWRDFEIEAVRGFRHALIEIVVDRAEELNPHQPGTGKEQHRTRFVRLCCQS